MKRMRMKRLAGRGASRALMVAPMRAASHGLEWSRLPGAAGGAVSLP